MKLFRILAAMLLVLVTAAMVSPAHAGMPMEEGEPTAGSGSGDSSGSSSSGGSGGGAPAAGVSVPRVMLTEFTTDPGSVVAGDEVEVEFTLENMSGVTRVENLRVTLSSDDAGAFLPVKGSSSLYIPVIYSGDSVTETMTLRTLPTLEERPYALTLQVEYEDANAMPYESSEKVAIPVSQPVRVDASDPQVLPAEIRAGQQASVTFNVNNLGKNQIFNVRASIPEGQAVAPQRIFIGTIEPGASGAVDLTVQAIAVNDEPITVQISYEDANGTVTTEDRTFDLVISVEQTSPPGPPMGPPPGAVEQSGSGLPLLPLVIGLLLVLLIVGVIVAVVRRRRRSEEHDSDIALLDDDPLVPPDKS